jgi:hypothetical protein
LTPLANAFLTKEQLSQPEDLFPLDLVFCPDCCLVQITETVNPEVLFQDYPFHSSCSEVTLSHSEKLANRIIKSRQLHTGSQIVEIGSNDGYLLQFYKQRSIPVLGIEPARNIADVANNELGIETINAFFNEPLAVELSRKGIQADVIHLHNILAHVSDLNGFVKGVTQILKDSGVIIVEVPYVRHLIEKCQYDTVYHEHLCYFSLTSLQNLFSNHRVYITDFEHTQNQGGSLRVFLSKSERSAVSGKVLSLLKDESKSGLKEFDFYKNFPSCVEKSSRDLASLINKLKSGNYRIAAYGASAKGSRRLQVDGLDASMIEYVVDNTPKKQGKFMPGVHVPIYPPENLVRNKVDHTLILAWNYSNEIISKEAQYRKLGGKFIIPSPVISIY